MILGLDTGLATCGWALLDETTCTLTDVGVIVQEKAKGSKIQTSQIDRALVQARELAERARSCSTIVVEAMSFPPGHNATVSIALSYGIAIGISAAMITPPRLLTISPQTWQRVVAPDSGKRVDYNAMAVAIERHIEARHPMAARALALIPMRYRDHALDAAALALIGKLQPGRCMSARAPRTRRPKQLVVLNDDAGPRWIPEAGLPPGGRDQCATGQRPCQYVRCKYHLWLQLDQDRAGRPHHGKRAPTTLRDVWTETNRYPRWHVRPDCQLPPSCALDFVRDNPDGVTSAELGIALGIGEERARQLAEAAWAKAGVDLEAAGW